MARDTHGRPELEPRTALEPETAEQRTRRLPARLGVPVALGALAVLLKWIVTAWDVHGLLHPSVGAFAIAVVLVAFGVFVVTRRPYLADRATAESEG